jgi:hypothetical protein
MAALHDFRRLEKSKGALIELRRGHPASRVKTSGGAALDAGCPRRKGLVIAFADDSAQAPEAAHHIQCGIAGRRRKAARGPLRLARYGTKGSPTRVAQYRATTWVPIVVDASDHGMKLVGTIALLTSMRVTMIRSTGTPIQRILVSKTRRLAVL